MKFRCRDRRVEAGGVIKKCFLKGMLIEEQKSNRKGENKLWAIYESRRSAPSQEPSSCRRVEDGCACSTWFRKDGKRSVMEDERIDPFSADNAMQRVQWYAHFLQNILKQDPTTAPASLHRLLLP